ncbi:MAG: SLC13 family permease [Alphaproteobacteria bacterium]|nr:SLC13 family permease [Alphaproteobacteria bacterium]MCZ6609608.1 SLC13 family permease [Alphaproteobacteria bacterium]MCZ6813104.1 SLC13 family permease [Alphaproteobacteria bacterium]
MTLDQILISAIILAVFGLFLWGRWRYDVVAVLALATATLLGIVPAKAMFAGFGHPATVTVALVLILSRGLQNAGATDIVAKYLLPPLKRPEAHIGALGAVAAGLSAVMNNVGALALLMPAALSSAARVKRSAAQVLMPVSFCSILGGLVTLIGTPPNIIVASFRGDIQGTPFSMFDFTPVGAAVAAAGIVFVALIGWRLIPPARRAAPSAAEAIHIEDYVSEARVGEDSAAIGQRLRELDAKADEHDAVILEVLRHGRRLALSGRHLDIDADDVLLIEAGPDALERVLKVLDLTAATERDKPGIVLGGEEISVMEAVVAARSALIGHTPETIRLRSRYGANLLAVSRAGTPIRSRLKNFRFREGDVLLLEGDTESLPDTASRLRCLPLAQRDITLGKLHLTGLAILVFVIAIAAAALGLVALPAALAVAAIAMVLFNIVPLRDLYEAIDWPVVVLIGAMIPVGAALQTTGATGTLIDGLLKVAAGASPVIVLVVVMVVTMTLSDVINNAATAVVMAPIGAGLAHSLGVSPDPFLMAVAISASCAFLTPIGHQNNTLIMGPGGYHFGDYWRMGLPLEAVVIVVSVPLLLVIWPL